MRYFYEIGQICEQEGNFNAAGNMYQKELEMLDNPKAFDFHMLIDTVRKLENIYAQTGERQKALDIYLNVLRRDTPITDGWRSMFITDFLNYCRKNKINVSDEHKDRLLSAAQKIKNNELRDESVNEIKLKSKRN